MSAKREVSQHEERLASVKREVSEREGCVERFTYRFGWELVSGAQQVSSLMAEDLATAPLRPLRNIGTLRFTVIVS